MRRDARPTERAESLSDVISSAGNGFPSAGASARWKGNNRRSDIYLLFPSALIKMLFMNRGGGGPRVCSSFGGVFKEISRMKPAPTLQVLVPGLN